MTSQTELENRALAATSIAAKAKKHKVPDRLTLSNGVVLKVKAMPPYLLNSVATSIPEPQVPTVFIDDKQREEPNPNHPDYIRAVADRAQAINLATINLILYACTEIEFIPEGVLKPEDTGWHLLASMAGVKFDDKDKVQLYLTWLRCYALSTVDDLNNVQTVPMILAGITEVEVDEALNSFRSGEGGGSDTGLPSEVGSQNGHNIPDAPARPNRRARRA